MVAPTVPSVANICLNESTTINNPNKQELTVVGPNGITTIKGNSSLQFTPDSEGIYNLGFMVNGIFNSKESFVVKPFPKADFTIDETYNYENGAPSINLSTNSQGVAHSWAFEGQNGTTSGTETKAHFFYKGEYDISLTVTGSNSCKSTVTKSVQIDETYNLMAHNVFDPMSSDNRLNSFMPTGLAQRSADFRMIIIDPTDGAIIFETSDVSNPWRGLDKRNGQMVSANKAYIWIATLNNPLKGENPEYKGTIVRQ
jgi:PKD repeat protein